jgi:hypothetical protein
MSKPSKDTMGEQGNNSTVLKAVLEEGRIGKKLVDENLISDLQLEEALLAQQSRGGRLGDNLIESINRDIIDTLLK